jgi:HSP20 family molecular chaperone IbpA
MNTQPSFRIGTESSRLWMTARTAAFTSMLLFYLPINVPAQDAPANDASFTEKMKNWQNEMSDKFSDTFKDLRRDFKDSDKTMAMVSVDLREKNDSYVIRLNLPDRDVGKTEVTLQGSSVSILVPAEGKGARYEQTVVLSDVAPGAQPVIERKQDRNLILVTIPKVHAQTEGGRAAGDVEQEKSDRDILDRMERMRRDMDRMVRDAFEDFRSVPEHRGFFDQSRFGSSVVLKDEGSSYVVRAYLPGRDLKDLNVNVENQTLKIEAKAEGTEEKKQEGVTSTYKANYSQMLTLPGPVVADQMKVDRKDEMVVITLPKAAAK